VKNKQFQLPTLIQLEASLVWVFSRTDSLRKGVLQQAGRLIRPKGKLTLYMAINRAVKSRFETVLNATKAPA
jgi:hypothetical protein